MRLAALLTLMSCVGSEISVVESPIAAEPPPPVAAAPAEIPAATGAELRLAYLDAVCGLHARPDCVESRASSCDDGLDLSDPAACRSMLDGISSVCPKLDQVIERHAFEVAACTSWLQAASCADQPACSVAGPREAQGPCAPVVALIQDACTDLEDRG